MFIFLVVHINFLELSPQARRAAGAHIRAYTHTTVHTCTYTEVHTCLAKMAGQTLISLQVLINCFRVTNFTTQIAHTSNNRAFV